MDRFERWAQKVEVTDTCWLWTASRFDNGYGYFQNKKAHCVAYEFFKGPIPFGLEADHTCRVRHCVNPNHLEAVTHYVNILRIRNTSPCPHGKDARRRCTPCRTEAARLLRAKRKVA